VVYGLCQTLSTKSPPTMTTLQTKVCPVSKEIEISEALTRGRVPIRLSTIMMKFLGMVIVVSFSPVVANTEHSSSFDALLDDDSDQNNDSMGRQLQSNTVVEPYECIPPNTVREIYLDSSDERLVAGSPSVTEDCFNRYDYCGSTMGPEACCRVSFDLGWVVCDSANGFASADMPCVCNENTFTPPTPTISPKPTSPPVTPTNPPIVPPTPIPTAPPITPNPTNSPTVPPTRMPITPNPTFFPTTLPPTSLPPTDSPTLYPTYYPTEETSSEPTYYPTVPPTTLPVPDPTMAPTREPPVPAPITTSSPTRYPTDRPTEVTRPVNPPSIAPIRATSSPTLSSTLGSATTTNSSSTNNDDDDDDDDSNKEFVTENREEEEFVRQTKCVETPPPSQVQATTFQYSYQVIPGSDIASTATTNGRFVTMLTDTLHDALVQQFFTCDFTQNAVWILQSALHEISPQPCSPQSNNDDNSCLVVMARYRLLAYDSTAATAAASAASQERNNNDNDYNNHDDYRREQRWLQRLLQAISDDFAMDMLAFVESGMSNGEFQIAGVTEDMSFQSGGIILLTMTPTESPTTTDTTTSSMTLEPRTLTPFTSSSPTMNDGDISNIVQGGTQPASVGKTSGLSTASIATITVTMTLILLLILLVVVYRRRRRTTDSDRGGYNSNGSTTLYDVDKLELDSPNTSRYGQRSTSSTRSRIDSPGRRGPTLVTSFTAPDDYDDFDDHYGAVTSPSRRVKRGPLTSQDELDGSSTYEDYVLGSSHRGGGTNNYHIDIDHDNNSQSPRTYPIQDTVNL
jgi:hypothetical protein